ncbi:IdeS/Mac family cysteine endopeptidase [Treponema socranskii]|uniref:IdeS/Mac family cysteine endopeptidase n=1 Tax=Treponema socranskii TaxID=53419 RepID=UPI003D8AD485
MIHNIKYLFKNKNKTILFAAIIALLFLSCANDLSKTDTAVTGIHVNSVGDSLAVVKGDTYRLQAKVLPEEVSDKSLSFSSDDAEIASVDAEGSITAHDVGNAGITIRAANGVQKKINVTVRLGVTSIEFEEQPADPVELIIGESYELKLKVMPEDVSNKELRITSSDDNIAWPTGDGNRSIKAYHDVGEATVTITSADNSSVIRTVRFKTKEKTTEPSISIETPSVQYGSDEADVTFTVKTLNGKLNYTPEVVGGGTKWLQFKGKDNTNQAEDVVSLHVEKNKTVWYRNAHIKFKDNNTNKYVKAAGKDLQVKIIQKRNDNPVVCIKWVHGITPPDEGEKHKIEIPNTSPQDYHEQSYVFTWDETVTTTFFNTRKVTHTGAPHGGFPDGNQCWAKTDANMLHWWFVQNENNINQYITKKNITGDAVNMYKPYYTRGLANDQEHEKSSIANLFRKTCSNTGGDPANGLNWYLFGLNFGNAKNKNSSPALFKDVFNKANTPVARVTIRTKKEFEDTLKAALDSKKAIGLNRYGAQDNTQHAITLWGAAFDEDDNIIAIYVVDNNDVPNRVFPYGIWYQDGVDIYAEPESDQNNPLRYNPYFFNYSSNSPSKNHCIGEIITLDKGEEQWQDWLSKNP